MLLNVAVPVTISLYKPIYLRQNEKALQASNAVSAIKPDDEFVSEGGEVEEDPDFDAEVKKVMLKKGKTLQLQASLLKKAEMDNRKKERRVFQAFPKEQELVQEIEAAQKAGEVRRASLVQPEIAGEGRRGSVQLDGINAYSSAVKAAGGSRRPSQITCDADLTAFMNSGAGRRLSKDYGAGGRRLSRVGNDCSNGGRRLSNASNGNGDSRKPSKGESETTDNSSRRQQPKGDSETSGKCQSVDGADTHLRTIASGTAVDCGFLDSPERPRTSETGESHPNEVPDEPEEVLMAK
eukprot:gnl/TRDRNA2_/TRDRNA2_129772_c0_seq1.p1 gnl/TRDRNA2_/TRDRNA2_129772_c0~~gnl/TRDRNA2_/TRDRNA2_129772_c0_seq1.p1  ORF type:complete len:306 (+),score=43.55 gnl/TRDRNA2_/TRDRNA2_129772_c0_seq1:39-920(+)